MCCWMSTKVGGSSYTRRVTSITWRLEKHSSYMLIKEQLAIRAREDLYFNLWTSKLDSIWPMWFLVVSKWHVRFAFLRAKYFLTFHVEHVNAIFDNSRHLRNSILEHLEIFEVLGLNVRQPLTGISLSSDRCLIDCSWDIDDISWPT